MIGHRQILEQRMRGRKPRCVFVTIGQPPAPLRFGGNEPEGEITAGALPEVFVGSDEPGTVDLRFLTGCRVVLLPVACSTERFWQWHDALQAAGATSIDGMTPDEEVIAWRA